jgi:hypothetical protein
VKNIFSCLKLIHGSPYTSCNLQNDKPSRSTYNSQECLFIQHLQHVSLCIGPSSRGHILAYIILIIMLNRMCIDIYTGHTQMNGAVLIVNTITTAPFFCVFPVYVAKSMGANHVTSQLFIFGHNTNSAFYILFYTAI